MPMTASGSCCMTKVILRKFSELLLEALLAMPTADSSSAKLQLNALLPSEGHLCYMQIGGGRAVLQVKLSF